jgi:circadian clock protein KaiC
MEMHLLRIHQLIEKYEPSNVIIDPITNLITASTEKDVHSMLMRLMDFLKEKGVTSVFTSLSNVGEIAESEVGISSLIDTWVLLRYTELFGKRHRGLFVLKARGMAHSTQLREMLITSQGIKLGPAAALLAYRDREREPQLDHQAALPKSVRSKGNRRTAALTRRSSRGAR